MSAEVLRYETVRFRCTGCMKSWATNQRCREHVTEGCIKDPETKACATCVHDNRGYPSSYEEPGEEARCEIGKRDATDIYVRHCPFWESTYLAEECRP